MALCCRWIGSGTHASSLLNAARHHDRVERTKCRQNTQTRTRRKKKDKARNQPIGLRVVRLRNQRRIASSPQTSGSLHQASGHLRRRFTRESRTICHCERSEAISSGAAPQTVSGLPTFLAVVLTDPVRDLGLGASSLPYGSCCWPCRQAVLTASSFHSRSHPKTLSRRSWSHAVSTPSPL